MADRRTPPDVTRHRFFLPSEAFVHPNGEPSAFIRFLPEQARQMRKVLRLREGDRVIALDGLGNEYVVRLKSVADDAAHGIAEARRRNEAEPRTTLSLYMGTLKAVKLELVLQKCTEIGVSRFVPVITARSVATEPSSSRQRRFQTIVREASEQSRRGLVPTVCAQLPFSEALQEASADGPIIFLWEEQEGPHLGMMIGAIHGPRVSLFVGPEGGFTPDEAERALKAHATMATLGRRILRAETAAIVGSALLLAD